MVALALGWSEVDVLTRGLEELDQRTAQKVLELVKERCSGRPFAYLEGHKEFYSRRFAVDERVLIPRPETEHLVDVALALSPQPRRVADLCTGSGCIAITLALEMPKLQVVASDLSIAALAVAHKNARAHKLLLRDPHPFCSTSRFSLVACDLASGVGIETFDTVVSNPPYISPDATDDTLTSSVREFEPHQALFAANNGLAFYQRLLGAQTPMVKGQRLVLELGAGQQEAVVKLSLGRFDVLSITKDLAGWPRVLSLRRI